MRVLLLAQFFPPDYGGEEWHVFNLANALASRGHDVSVATQHMAGVPDEEVLSSGVRVYRFSTTAMRLPGVYTTTRPHHPPVPDPMGVRELRRIIGEVRPDVVHAHNWIVNSVLPLRGKSRERTFGLVLTLHDFSYRCATKRLMRKGQPCDGPALARCLACATRHYNGPVGPFTVLATRAMRPWKDHAIDHIVSVSSAVARENGVLRLHDSSVISNFVADEALAATSTDDRSVAFPELPLPTSPYVLFVGDLCEEKGVQVLLRAYESLTAEGLPLVLIGKRRPDTPSWLPPGAQMHFDWPHEHVMEAFRRCLFAVLPSVWPDPCPTTVLEAMASGRPVLATSTGGIVDLVEDGVSGRLVAPGSVDDLASAMRCLADDPDLQSRLAAGARKRATSFTVSAVVERLEEIYVGVAPSRPGAPSVGDVRGLV